MSATLPVSLNLRLLALIAALVLAAAATFAAISAAGQAVVHASIDRTGSVHVTGYDGGVSLTNNTQP